MTESARNTLVAGNWKMNGSTAASRELVDGLLEGYSPSDSAEMLLCPTFVYLRDVATWIAASDIKLGAQNLSEQQDTGAYTGEIQGAMLKDVGCTYVIVGHSERRTLYGESDALVASKFIAAQAQNLTPIVCVGESLQQREDGSTEAVVRRQIDAVLDVAGVDAFARAVIAYEPIWAIGTGHTATPEQAQEVHAVIRDMIASRSDTIAAGLRILYGGSVKGANAEELFAMNDIDGGLVGGASLSASDFLAIYRAAAG
jgi:triosephosphate isomerase